MAHPDEKSIITYVSSLYDAMPRALDAHDGIRINVSLHEMKQLLSDLIKSHLIVNSKNEG